MSVRKKLWKNKYIVSLKLNFPFLHVMSQDFRKLQCVLYLGIYICFTKVYMYVGPLFVTNCM